MLNVASKFSTGINVKKCVPEFDVGDVVVPSRDAVLETQDLLFSYIMTGV